MKTKAKKRQLKARQLPEATVSNQLASLADLQLVKPPNFSSDNPIISPFTNERHIKFDDLLRDRYTSNLSI